MVVTGLLLELNGVSATTDPYALPKDKSRIDYCRKAVLAEQPGQVLEFKSQNTHDGFHYQYVILAQDRNHWRVICDGASQKIIDIRQQ